MVSHENSVISSLNYYNPGDCEAGAKGKTRSGSTWTACPLAASTMEKLARFSVEHPAEKVVIAKWLMSKSQAVPV